MKKKKKNIRTTRSTIFPKVTYKAMLPLIPLEALIPSPVIKYSGVDRLSTFVIHVACTTCRHRNKNVNAGRGESCNDLPHTSQGVVAKED